MIRSALLALLFLAAPLAARALDFGLPEMGLAPSGACRTLAVRDRAKGTMVPIGCLDSGARGFVSTSDASDAKVTPSEAAAAGSLGRFLAVPTMVRGKVLDVPTAPPTGNYESFVVQNSAVTGQDIISPQMPPGHYKGENIRSSMVVPAGTTTGTNSAFGFYVRNDSTADAVGVFGTTVCNKNGASCWGFNPTVIDHTANGVDTSATNLGRILVGSELDVQVTSTDTTVSGYNCTGSSGVQPKGADCFQVGHLLAADPSRGIKWTSALSIGDGTSVVGLRVGAAAVSGANGPGTPNYFNFRDAAAAVRAVVVQASGTGALNVGRTDGANGVALVPAAAGVSPSLQAFGTDTNVDLSLRGQGTGRVLVQSPATFNGAVTLAGGATASLPIKLPVYTVANLPTCNAAALGSMAAVSDATAPTYNGALTGGGTVPIPVFCRGDVWLAH